MEFGRVLGNDEPVIPSFPNSDYSYATLPFLRLLYL
jgi:hypothetical protein